MRHAERGRVVAALGTAQTLAWASSYYLPAVLAPPMARSLETGTPTIFAAFSVALVVAALVGPRAGTSIDRHGGRPVLMTMSVVFALGLALLGVANSTWALFGAWALLGVAMGAGLYEGAFAALVRLYGHGSRNSITGITLIAGFASTVGWPLSAWMETRFGWRSACFGWAGLHLLVALPLNALLPRHVAALDAEEIAPAPRDLVREASARTTPAAQDAGAIAPVSRELLGEALPARATSTSPRAGRTSRATALMAFVFAVTWFTSTAMAAHLPSLLQASGTTLAAAVAAGTLIGPAQVGGRLIEFWLLRGVHPLVSARIAAVAHPLGVVALLLAGPALAPLFAVLHGAGNGVLTIAKGTLPLALFGPENYGARQGWLMVPARIAQASAPWLFGLALAHLGAAGAWITAALGVAALVALLALRSPPHARALAPQPVDVPGAPAEVASAPAMTRWFRIEPHEARSVAWRNGRGTTRQFALWPPTASFEAGDFDWRISAAGVAEDGPFSTFSGFDRVLVITAGAGLELDHGDGRVVLKPLEPYGFSGNCETWASMVGGPVHDFGVMVRRGRYRTHVEVAHLHGRVATVQALAGEHAFVHVLAGEVSARLDSEDGTLLLARGDSAWIQSASTDAEASLTDIGTGAIAITVRIWPVV